ncbi:hypothetical protein N7478_006252 [Penicillium angulare]|uniref:uncharacterized protein n=1 Tax=Penicillium angulare TaxID=116970 RepID=UPI00253FD6D9|nr:uncharacterized protein N7478_006252 [Penicillium angulare]KAJ5280880.1 hypothetical protein N7478_006252 [Penicillium angulare]
MMKADWHPRWEREDSSPAFASPPLAHNPHNPFGEDKWLWGNVPAVDILKLVDNEGENYSENIAILFAASGDLRNVVKTISQLPDAFTQHLEVTINDQEFHVVARNAIILLFILTMLEDKDAPVGGSKATDSLIHLWYSASLPNGIISDIASRVHPLIIEVCCGVSDMAAEEVVEKTWIFSHGNSLHLSLKKEDWFRMQALCRVPPDLTKDKASKIRTATTLADARRDFRDRWAFKEASPSARVSKQKFREDGLLLPFAHNRAGFDIPNPTFFLRPFSWPLDDKRDPMDGWSIIEVYGVKTVAKEDIYGKLYLYLQSVFRKFLDRLSAANVSNITDGTYLGTRQTLNIMSQLLQPTHKNSHAIIIASYLNAVMEMVTQGSETDKVPDIDLLVTHFPKLNLLSFLQPESADALRIWDARTVVLDRDKFFER